MAQTITYNDKTYLNENSSIADENKVKDTDMNEIKSVVNANATILDNQAPQAITLETNVVTGVISATTKFALNKVRNQVGTQITGNTSTHRVIIGSGVSNVMVSAQVQGARQGGGAVQIELRKNGTQIKKAYMSATDSFQTMPILPFIESVQENDYFELYLIDGSINGSSGLSNQTLVYITVQKIN